MTKEILEERSEEPEGGGAAAEELRAIATADVDIAMSMASFHHFVDQQEGAPRDESAS